MKLSLLSFLAFSVFSFSCVDDDARSRLATERILFYVAYENHAWGDQFNGWFVDNQGNVWDLKSPVKWWDKEVTPEGFHGEYHIGKDSLFREYSSKAEGIIFQIGAENMDEGLELASRIRSFSYSEPKNVMADAGITLFGYVVYDPARKTFRQIPLATEGDWEYQLNDEKAQQLKEWLKGVRNDIEDK